MNSNDARALIVWSWWFFTVVFMYIFWIRVTHALSTTLLGIVRLQSSCDYILCCPVQTKL
jgi:hypothetical protein